MNEVMGRDEDEVVGFSRGPSERRAKINRVKGLPIPAPTTLKPLKH